MKKTLLTFIFMIVILFTSTVETKATWQKTFTDDFQSYELGKAEDQQAVKDVWTNDGWSGENLNPTDINNVATIKQEGTNKYLNLKYQGSFFYMSPKNFRAKEFDFSFKMRSNSFEDAWVGINMRKEYRDIRYNGGTGLMIYFRSVYTVDKNDQIVGEAITVEALRGGSLSTTDLTGLMEGEKAVRYNYPEGEAPNPNEQLKGRWLDIKITVRDTTNKNEALYEVFIDDVKYASLIYARSSLNVSGYFGLHACMSDVDIDDVHIVSYDAVSPPPIVRVNKLVTEVGKVGEVMEFPGGEEGDLELIDDADGIVVLQIKQPNEEIITLEQGVFEFTPTMEGIHILSYIVENSENTKSQKDFLINVKPSEQEGSEVPETPEKPETPETPEPPETPETPNQPEEKKGLGAIIPIIISVAAVVVIGVGVVAGILIKKKK